MLFVPRVSLGFNVDASVPQLNVRNPLTFGLVRLVLPGTMGGYDLAASQSPTFQQYVNARDDIGVVGATFAGLSGTDEGVLRYDPVAADDCPEYTILSVATWRTGSGSRYLTGRGAANNTSRFFMLVDDGPVFRVYAYDATTVYSLAHSVPTVYTTERRRAYAMTISPSTSNMKSYVDGVRVQSGTGPSTLNTTTDPTAIGNQPTPNNTSCWQGSIEITAIWNRVLTEDEIFAVSVDPFQLVTRSMDFLSGSLVGFYGATVQVTGNSVTASVGTVTTAQAVVFPAGNSVTATAGSLNFSVQAEVTGEQLYVSTDYTAWAIIPQTTDLWIERLTE